MTDNYWEFFLNSSLSIEDPGAVFILLFLFLARILPIIALSPFFGARVLPHPVKLAFAISLFAIFVPHLLVVTQSKLSFTPLSLALFAKELFVGYLIGFLISIPFTIVQTAGMLIDHQRGGASLMVNDPTIQNQSSPLGTMFNMVLIYIFFMIDGPFYFIDAINTSYSAIPPDRFFNPQFFDKSSAFSEIAFQLLNNAMVLAIQFASPALIAILMTDVFLGIANRLATQVQITFLGLPLKSLLGLTLITIGWKVLINQMAEDSHRWMNVIDRVLIIFDIGRQ
ncbi:EscT/YscT/HrcT family type III secretion system export apparatus protein [Waddlia chondrophila]|uniref:Putative type III secretion inner membrane protein SctT n=1 Tax=Waddlia chondrophila (strain ATCC VR-1470 / WSU 86-1044) TaxID=716544 RepID=D6YTK5_WADCW|nr:flagellar biosynthetic protein FliR [Waddlia chondrophila]ADI37466.1 putative type III secretion inner membrane protein SctT [Waddlia chondrophila WSU 86-1044]